MFVTRKHNSWCLTTNDRRFVALKSETMRYAHVRRLLSGLVVIWIGFQQGLSFIS